MALGILTKNGAGDGVGDDDGGSLELAAGGTGDGTQDWDGYGNVDGPGNGTGAGDGTGNMTQGGARDEAKHGTKHWAEAAHRTTGNIFE